MSLNAATGQGTLAGTEAALATSSRCADVSINVDDPDTVRAARNWTRSVLSRLNVEQSMLDDAVLVVSELVTNAVLASRGLVSPSVHLNLRLYEGSMLEIGVFDMAPGTPILIVPGTETVENGRGLALVVSLCRTVEVVRYGCGKSVTATLIEAV
jgi:anti-sigma regulatory factor (Ser/Thr protein kinase)